MLYFCLSSGSKEWLSLRGCNANIVKSLVASQGKTNFQVRNVTSHLEERQRGTWLRPALESAPLLTCTLRTGTC